MSIDHSSYEVRQDFRINSGIGRPALKSNVHRTNVRIPDVRLMCHSLEKQQGGAIMTIMAISLWVQTCDGLAFGQATACRKLLAAGRSGKTRRGCPKSVAGGGHGKRVAEQLKNGVHFRNDLYRYLGLLNHF
jgi:hypothetical protein